MGSRVPCSYPPPPQWHGPPGCTPFPSICKLLAAFLRSTLVFARSLLHFWLPASHLLGTCYLLDDLHSTHTPSKYLCATCSHIYMCYVSTSYLFIYIYICAVPHPHHTTGGEGHTTMADPWPWPGGGEGGWNAGPYIDTLHIFKAV